MLVRKAPTLRTLPLQTNAVYAIEATVHAPTFQGVYSEIFKILKPGGVVRLFPFPSFMRHVSLILASSSVSTSGL